MLAADYCTPQSGNFVASIIALARRLREDGHKVLFVFPEEREWQEWIHREGFNVVCTGKENLSSEKQFQTLKDIVEQYNIELIHSHFGMFHHAIVYDRKKIKQIKIVLHDHMDFSIHPGIVAQYFRMIIWSFIYSVKKIRVISVMKRKHRSYWFLTKKWYVPNGLSMERNIKVSMSREECRKKLGMRNNDKVVFMLGWDMKGKGLDIALKAVKECREKNPDICFGIIGVGNPPSEFAKEFISSETGIDYKSEWIHFFESQEDMFAVHRAVDVYISSSRKGAFSYGLLEAISQNTPVVVSDIPGTRWAEEYDNSFFYSTENVCECSEAILAALKCGRCESNAREIVDKYGIDQWINEIIKIYDEI